MLDNEWSTSMRVINKLYSVIVKNKDENIMAALAVLIYGKERPIRIVKIKKQIISSASMKNYRKKEIQEFLEGNWKG